MCGIAGFVTFDPPRNSPERVREMLGMLAHRGPDGEGRYVSKGRRLPKVALGNRRLAIIDLEGGRQPVYSESKDVVAVFNGEIYNYKELRRNLESRGHQFVSASDTEVIPHMYEEFGVDFLGHLRGMFAIALFDGARLILARDRFGIKPLYYAELEGRGVCFASEPQAMAPLVSLEPEPALLPTYLSLSYFPAPLSPYRSVRKVPAGCMLEYDGDGIRTRRWWEPRNYFQPRRVGVERLRSALEDSVACHLVGDVPLGVFASGGLDSSVVASLAARIGRRDLIAFTVGFKAGDDGSRYSFDERERAEVVARHLGLEQISVEAELPGPGELFDLAAKYGEPIGDEAALPTYAVAKAAREYVKVVLTGEGGDELFGGYDKYRTFHLLRPLMAVPLRLHPPIVDAVRYAAGEHRARKIAGILGGDLVEAGRSFDEVVTESERGELLSPDVRSWPVAVPLLWESVLERKRSGDLDPQWMRSTAEGIAERYLLSSEELASLIAGDICGYLADGLLHKVDAATMAHGLEARVPYLDHELFEAVGGVAMAAGLDGGSPITSTLRAVSSRSSKAALRRVAENLLPEETVSRKKQGFGVPLADWIALFAAGEVGRALTDRERLAEQGWWNTEAVARLVGRYREHIGARARPPRHVSRAVWLLFAYQLWLECIPGTR